jgi:ribonuclease E
MVIKEGIGTKGPTLSTYISISGRYLVLMPSLKHVGVSRKIEDEATRQRLRKIMNELNPPKGLGFIVRTAGADRTRKELAQDMAYLMRLWKVIVKRIKTLPAPIEIYRESDMIIRTIRDMATVDIDKIVIDEKDAYDRVKDFLESAMPRYVDRLEYYDQKEPLFLRYNLEDAIAQIHQRRVPLKDGGSIVIDQTEALVAIDVNSGSFRTNESAEENAFQMNLRAAKEIARQIRLRDLGGVIVNDFIDMDSEQHQRAVERTLRDSLKRDRAKTKILRTSPFGLIEMTRQRIRPGVKRSIYRDCPCCHGGGVVKSVESMAIDVMRDLSLICQNSEIVQVRINVADEVSEYLNNKKRLLLAQLEEETGIEIVLRGDPVAWPEHLKIECFNKMGNLVNVKALPDSVSTTP